MKVDNRGSAQFGSSNVHLLPFKIIESEDHCEQFKD